MPSDKKSAGVVSLIANFELSNKSLSDEQLTTVIYPSLEAWQSRDHLTGYKVSSPSGSRLTNAQFEDCLAIFANVIDIVEMRIVPRIKQIQPQIPIIVLVPQPTIADAVAIMQQGAYSVANLADSDASLSSLIGAAASQGQKTAHMRHHLATLQDRLSQLTNPEQQVLNAMLDGMANKQIAQALSIGLRTVELRRSKIMRKMNARSLAELVKFVCQAQPETTMEQTLLEAQRSNSI